MKIWNDHGYVMGPGHHVLIIDSHADTRELYIFNLRLAGFDAEAVENGTEALQHARRCTPAAVVTDLCLPGLDGIELVKRLRAQGTNAPVLLVTGWVSIPIRERAASAGIQSVVLKPCRPDEFVAWVAALTAH